MEEHKLHLQGVRTYSPTRQDYLTVLLMTVGTFLLLLPLAQNIHPQAIGWIVMVIVIGLPVVTINMLLPFSHWEQPFSEEGSHENNKESHEREREQTRIA